ncbi:MAG: pyruvate formate lyase family protein, partial [candidate division WOR-3 bacterium]
DVIVGRETEHLVGAPLFFDQIGDAMPGLWEEAEILPRGLVFKSKEDREIARECARFFAGRSVADQIKKAWTEVVGNWWEDMLEAKGFDPSPDSGYFPGVTCRGMWEKLLSSGLRGVIDQAKANIEKFRKMEEADISKYYFWQSAIIVCEAAIRYAKKYAEAALKMAQMEPNPERKKELLEIAQICEWVPENPPRTFHEALQFINFIMVCRGLEVMYPILVGRMDQYLWPYLENDLDKGLITLEKAAELLGNALILWGTKVVAPVGKTQLETHQFSYSINSINVGGVKANGEDATNPLSYLILHMVGLLRLSSPTVVLNWHKGMPRQLLLKALETNLKTKGGIPLFINSDHIVSKFVEQGVPIEEAREWCSQGCVTPILPTRIDHNGSEGRGAINLALVLDVTLHRGIAPVTGKRVGLDLGDPRDFKSFEELYDAFKKQYEFICKRWLWLGTVAQSVEPKYLRLPFTSCVTGPGCIEKGQDILIPDSNHSYGLSDRAIVDVADSLMAIKKLVFERNELTMEELLTALDRNFEGKRGEEIRQMCLSAPKFGNDIEEVDLLVRELGAFSASVIMAYKNPFGVPCKISREGLSWHYYGGLGVGALPNGRRAREPLNDGSISPMRGMDKNGPTAVLRSVLRAGFKESFASCLNMKFTPTVLRSAETREKMAILLETFFKNGGQHAQFNIVDVEELLDAKIHPEKHRDLVVRVGGFSAFFVMLSSEVQDDIIMRTHYTSC